MGTTLALTTHLVVYEVFASVRRFRCSPSGSCPPDACADAANKVLCGQLFFSGWLMFVGTVVGLIVFYNLTLVVPFMRNWYPKRTERPWYLLLAMTAIGFVFMINARRWSGG